MQNNNQNQNAKHIRPFWTITIVVVIAVILGGVIYFYTLGNELQDDLFSISFTSPVHIQRVVKKPAAKTTVKTGVKAPVSATPTK